MQALWSLSAGAKITSACQELAEAVNKLRFVETLRVADGGESDRRAIMAAAPAAVLQINNIADYMRGLNRGQGMGFALRRKKITYSLVYGPSADNLLVPSPQNLGLSVVIFVQPSRRCRTVTL